MSQRSSWPTREPDKQLTKSRKRINKMRIFTEIEIKTQNVKQNKTKKRKEKNWNSGAKEYNWIENFTRGIQQQT